jgi:hypothetical protein
MPVLAFHVIAPDFLFQRNLKVLKFMHNRRPASELSLYGQGPLIKRAFANAPMKCGPHMAACTAKRISTGLRPNGKCWRHRRQSSPANQIRRRTHGRPHVRRPPERSRGLADAADLTRDASPCSAAISTKGGDYARGLARRSAAEKSDHWHRRLLRLGTDCYIFLVAATAPGKPPADEPDQLAAAIRVRSGCSAGLK